MLTILGRGQQYCDRITRRSFLKVGGFTFGSLASLSLADLLRAEAATGKRHGHQAVINIFLAGGPPHQDLWDVKTEAPSEIRGEFKPIKTKVAGIQICEVFPKIAAMMDRFAIIRSVVGSDGDHDGYQCLSGWSRRAKNVTGGYPAIGPVLWKGGAAICENFAASRRVTAIFSRCSGCPLPPRNFLTTHLPR